MKVCCFGKNSTFLCVYYHFWALSWLSLFVSHKDGISSLKQSLCALSIRNTSWFVYLYSTGQAEVRIYFLKKTDLMWKVILQSFTAPVALDKHHEEQLLLRVSPTCLSCRAWTRWGMFSAQPLSSRTMHVPQHWRRINMKNIKSSFCIALWFRNLPSRAFSSCPSQLHSPSTLL